MPRKGQQHNLSVTEILKVLGPHWSYSGGSRRTYLNDETGEILSRRKALDRAVAAHPERFGGKQKYEEISPSKPKKAHKWKSWQFVDFQGGELNQLLEHLQRVTPTKFYINAFVMLTEQVIGTDPNDVPEEDAWAEVWRNLIKTTKVSQASLPKVTQEIIDRSDNNNYDAILLYRFFWQRKGR